MASNERQHNPDVSMRIKELRAELGWSQKEMAKVLGVKLTRYQKWEQRGRIPSEYLPAFSKLTNRTIEFILTGGHLVPG